MLGFDFEVIDDYDDLESVARPEDGMNVVGMYMEGCRWNKTEKALDESEPKVLYVPCPMVWFKPMKTVDVPATIAYECPIYKTSIRRGVLATTGHSTNFVLLLRLPTREHPDHWTMRGVAVLCSLDD